MGVLKILVPIAACFVGMSIFAFRLGNQLPKANRIFGNYIGLGYIYFKCLLKHLRPNDHMTYEMIAVARKTSQQSEALRRELRNTVKKVKIDIKASKDQLFKDFEGEALMKDLSSTIDMRLEEGGAGLCSEDGSTLMARMMKTRGELQQKRRKKAESSKFYTQL